MAVAAIVTSYLVAYGSGRFASGVKIRIVVPDQRNEPGIAGVTVKNGAVTRAGTLPSATIGSEKTTRISLASASVASSPPGAALTTRSAGRSPCAGCAAALTTAAATSSGTAAHCLTRIPATERESLIADLSILL